MKQMQKYVYVYLILCVMLCGCVPKFARWDAELLKEKEISPTTPLNPEYPESYIARSWYMCGHYIQKLDKTSFLSFDREGSFVLYVGEDIQADTRAALAKMFPGCRLKGELHGRFRCYDVDWGGGSCDGTQGVIFYDLRGRELSRCCFSCALFINGEDYGLEKVFLPNPYKDDLRSEALLNLYRAD